MNKLTAAQRGWLAEMGTLVGEIEADADARTSVDRKKGSSGEDVVVGKLKDMLSPEGNRPMEIRDPDARPPASVTFPEVAPKPEDKPDQEPTTKSVVKGFGPEDIIPIIPGVIDDATDRRATCAIHNNTQSTLTLDTASLSEIDDESGKTPGIVHGEYTDFPPSQIGPGDKSGRFAAKNKKVLIFSTTGVEAVVRYTLDAQGTAWILHFDNPFGVARGTGNAVDARVEGPNAAKFDVPRPAMSGKNDVKYLFILNEKGGGGPAPVPTPTPTPTPTPGQGPDLQSSCQIVVKNNTELPLTLSDAGHDRGDFMTLVPDTVPPGGSITVVSVETPHAADQGCKGFIVWEVGSPMSAVWRIEWDNPEGAKNTSDASLTPQTAGFKSVDQIGQGEENVPASFTISGGPKGEAPGPKPPGPGPVPPGPTPGPTPGGPEPAFEPPEESKQPTLRKGDKSEDGWVEYAQMLLNLQLKGNLAEDGNFGPGTHSAVMKFQRDNKLQVDGVIGNQTWAALREGAPEKPASDGRDPHSFVEKGIEARWVLESALDNGYFTAADELRLAVESVGDTPVPKGTEATIRITAPGATPRIVKMAIGDPTPSKTRKAFTNEVKFEQFRKNFPSVPPDAPVTEYLVEAYLPKDLGGDFYSQKVRVQE